MNYKLKISSKVFYRVQQNSFKFLIKNAGTNYDNYTSDEYGSNNYHNGIIVYQRVFKAKLLRTMYET